MKRILFTVFLSFLYLSSVQAANLQSGDSLTLSELKEDSYIFGKSVHVSDVVSGDLAVITPTLEVSGVVKQDLFALAKSIKITKEVQDDVRVIASVIQLDAPVQGDVILAGEQVEITPNAEIFGDAIIFGKNVNFQGRVHGNVRFYTENFAFAGEVQGATIVESDALKFSSVLGGDARIMAKNMVFSSPAKIMGQLEYWQKKGEDASLKDFVAGKLIFNPNLASNSGWFSDFNLYPFFSGLFFLGLASFLFLPFFKKSAQSLEKNMGKSALYGFFYFLGIPFLLLVLMLTLVGIPLAVFGFVLYGFSLYFAKIITSLVFAAMFESYYNFSFGAWTFLAFAFGVFILLSLLPLLPVFGNIAVFIAFCMAFGAAVQNVLASKKAKK